MITVTITGGDRRYVRDGVSKGESDDRQAVPGGHRRVPTSQDAAPQESAFRQHIGGRTDAQQGCG